MEGFKLVLFIILISLTQVILNLVISYLNTIYLKSNNIEKQPIMSKTAHLAVNIICFTYSMYILLYFIKVYIIPEMLDIYTLIQSIL